MRIARPFGRQSEPNDLVFGRRSLNLRVMETLDTRQRDLYAHWLACWDEDAKPPVRAQFDPLDHPRALSTLVLAEVLRDDFVFRVVGTDMVEAWGRDFTGELLSQVMQGAYHDFIRGLFTETVRSQRALFSHSRFQWDRGRSLDTKRLMLPYRRRRESREIGFVLVSQVFDYGVTGPEVASMMVDRDFRLLELERRPLAAQGQR